MRKILFILGLLFATPVFSQTIVIYQCSNGNSEQIIADGATHTVTNLCSDSFLSNSIKYWETADGQRYDYGDIITGTSDDVTIELLPVVYISYFGPGDGIEYQEYSGEYVRWGQTYHTPPADIFNIPSHCRFNRWAYSGDCLPPSCALLFDSDNQAWTPDTDYVFDFVWKQWDDDAPLIIWADITCAVTTHTQGGMMVITQPDSDPVIFSEDIDSHIQWGKDAVFDWVFIAALLQLYNQYGTDGQFTVTAVKSGSNFLGFSPTPDGSSGGIFNFDLKTGEILSEPEPCLVPECTDYYMLWDGDGSRLSIDIDWNGGIVTGLMEEPISGLWSFSDALGASQSDLAQMSGMDIYAPLMDAFGNDIVAACQSGEIDCMNPGHTLVGFSTSPDGMVENPTCVFPECNTLYAIWAEQTLQICPTYKYIKTSTGLSVPLYATKNTTPSISIGIGESVCYADLIPGRASGAINIEYNGQIYHTEQ